MRTTLAFLIYLLFCSAAHARFTIDVIALTGQTAPDGNGNFSIFSSPILNDASQVAFSSNLTDTLNGVTDNRGLFRGDGRSSLVQIVRSGQMAPDGNGYFRFLISPNLNNAGEVSFSGQLGGTANFGSDDTGIYRGDGMSLVQIVRKGQALPDGNGTLSPSVGHGLNDAGQVLFANNVSGSISEGFYQGNGTTGLVQIAREGQAIPGGHGTIVALGGSSTLNDDGQVAFTSLIQVADTFRQVLFRSVETSSLEQIAQEGLIAPGGDETFSFFSGIQLNGAGQTAFFGGLNNTEGIFRSDGTSSLVQIARQGQAVPDGNGTFNRLRRPILNDSGEATFLAELSGTVNGSADNMGIFRGDGTNLLQIARTGQAAPDGNGTFTGFANAEFAPLNNAGLVAFLGNLKDTDDGSSDDLGLYLYGDDIGLTQVARRGDKLLGSSITSLDFNGTIRNNDKRHGLNNLGQVAFSFQLADGRDGIAIATRVPEPAACVLLAALACFLFCVRYRAVVPLCCLLLGYALISPAHAQFTTVIDVPPNVAPASIGSDTQLNLADGGRILGRGLEIGSADGSSENVEVNIHGGVVSGDLTVHSGGSLNIHGGAIPLFNCCSITAIEANAGSHVAISGGGIGASIRADEGSDVELIGGEFRLNGRPYDVLTLSLNQPLLQGSRAPDVLTATLSDGTPLILSSFSRVSSLRLTNVSLPEADATPIIVDSNSPVAPIGLRPGQSMSVVDGGSLPEEFYAVGSTVTFAGGSTGRHARFAESIVEVSAGTVSADSEYVANSTVTLNGGRLDRPDLYNSTLTINGGIVRGDVDALFQSSIVLNDGIFESIGSTVSQVDLFDSSFDVRGGSTQHVAAYGGTVRISGGEVYSISAIQNPFANISDVIPAGSLVEMRDGVVRASIRVLSESEFHMFGGSLGGPETSQSALGLEGGTAHVMGGDINDDVWLSSGGELNLQGGTIDGLLRADTGSTINLLVRDLYVDGEFVELSTDAALEIAYRDGALLQATLVDGSHFEMELNASFELNDEFKIVRDFISPEALLTARLVPEPAAVVMMIACVGAFSLRRSIFRASPLLVVVAFAGTPNTTHAQFTTVIDVPPDIAPAQVGSNTQVNVLSDGVLPEDFRAGAFDSVNTNIEVNLSEGSASNGMTFHKNVVANVSGGAHGGVSAFGARFAMSAGTVDGITIFPSLFPLGEISSVANLSGGSVSGEITVSSPGPSSFGEALLVADGIDIGEGLQVIAAGALRQASVELSDSVVGGTIRADDGGLVRLATTTVAGDVNVFSASILEMQSGSIEGQLFVGGVGLGALSQTRATAEISGGTFGRIQLAAGVATFYGTQFTLDSVDITGDLTIGTPTEVDVEDATLTGLLKDGSPLSLDFTDSGNDIIGGNVVLKLVLVGPLLPGDYNGDDVVDAADYTVWRDNFGATGSAPYDLGDGDGDGDTDGADYLVWQRQFGMTLDNLASAASVSKTVPEPTTFALLALYSAFALQRIRKDEI